MLPENESSPCRTDTTEVSMAQRLRDEFRLCEAKQRAIEPNHRIDTVEVNAWGGTLGEPIIKESHRDEAMSIEDYKRCTQGIPSYTKEPELKRSECDIKHKDERWKFRPRMNYGIVEEFNLPHIICDIS